MKATVTLSAILTLEEAAAYLHVSPRLLAEMTREGRVPAMKAGRKWVYPATRLAEYVAAETRLHVPEEAGIVTEVAEPASWDPFERSMPRRKAVNVS